MEVAVSRDRGCGKQRQRWKYAETENAYRYYFISMTSTIYPMLVLIVKETDMSILSTQTRLVNSGVM
jgi:hypothetical protein